MQRRRLVHGASSCRGCPTPGSQPGRAPHAPARLRGTETVPGSSRPWPAGGDGGGRLLLRVINKQERREAATAGPGQLLPRSREGAAGAEGFRGPRGRGAGKGLPGEPASRPPTPAWTSGASAACGTRESPKRLLLLARALGTTPLAPGGPSSSPWHCWGRGSQHSQALLQGGSLELGGSDLSQPGCRGTRLQTNGAAGQERGCSELSSQQAPRPLRAGIQPRGSPAAPALSAVPKAARQEGSAGFRRAAPLPRAEEAAGAGRSRPCSPARSVPGTAPAALPGPAGLCRATPRNPSRRDPQTNPTLGGGTGMIPSRDLVLFLLLEEQAQAAPLPSRAPRLAAPRLWLRPEAPRVPRLPPGWRGTRSGPGSSPTAGSQQPPPRPTQHRARDPGAPAPLGLSGQEPAPLGNRGWGHRGFREPPVPPH